MKGQPQILPGCFLKVTGETIIDGKKVKLMSMERDLRFEHMPRPNYKVYKGNRDGDNKSNRRITLAG